jgi:hypothetical protein
MRKFASILTGIGVALLFLSGGVLADDGNIQTMAQITLSLHHFPSDDDKTQLQKIIDSDYSADEEADIAMVIANFEHKVQEKDTERLTDIIDDDAATENSRKLASILLRIHHTPSDEDKMTLAALAKE